MACAKAGAAKAGIPQYEFLRLEAGAEKLFVMPVPFFNVLNGGVYSGNKIVFQETLIAPFGASLIAEARSELESSTPLVCEFPQISLGRILVLNFNFKLLGVVMRAPHEALDLLIAVVSNARYIGKIKLAIDPTSSEFYQESKYDIGFKGASNPYSPTQMIQLYQSLLQNYPMIFLKDLFSKKY
ncbi:hypothetical protein N7520_003281 [Penicillium odoratum]|uniref:uncharacterized protein n=1 Tax=Penicillium odoratum TaxID=1167516 RepID=UPI0025481936|nr:uncharacterized protein N7520_003281 [Penicillium odoratum]KAJ5768722.1 hypothetical protein N7520_003281 [Penicillium odoratum]